MTKKQSGFTIIELMLVIVLLGATGTIFYLQKEQLNMSTRDTARKTAINAIHFNLEELYFPAAKGYPEHITTDRLKGLDPKLLKDQNGVAIGQQPSEYRYEPRDCANGLCRGYTLRANLEQEADFIKTSRT